MVYAPEDTQDAFHNANQLIAKGNSMKNGGVNALKGEVGALYHGRAGVLHRCGAQLGDGLKSCLKNSRGGMDARRTERSNRNVHKVHEDCDNEVAVKAHMRSMLCRNQYNATPHNQPLGCCILAV
jgi:hypothetical protein